MSFKRLFVMLTFLLFVLIAKIGHSQTQELSFNHIAGSNGVSVGKVNSIIQDKFGFIWLSDQTNRCIVRYDGNHMKRYSYSQGKPNTLGGYYPECLATDSTGIIWIGFYGQGLDRFDPLTNTFTHYAHDEADTGSLTNNVVSAVLVDHLGNVWVGTDGGLDLFDQKTGKFTHFQHDPSNPVSLSHNLVRTIYEDRKGELWIGTGMAFTTDTAGGLNRLDRSTGTFTRYLHDPANPNTLIDNRVRSIFEDSYGNFWIVHGVMDFIKWIGQRG